MSFRWMRVSVHTVTNIYTISLYVPPKISNSAADYEKKNCLTPQKQVARKLLPVNSAERLRFRRATMLP
jgi:hypothetical protein